MNSKKFGDLIVQLSIDAIEELNLKAGEKRDQVFYNYIAGLLHVVDRLAFNKFGASKRSQFMNELLVAIKASVIGMLVEGKISKMAKADDLLSIINKRAVEYTKYDLEERKESEGYAGFLPWEFGQAITRVISNERDPEQIMVNSILFSSKMFAITEAFNK